MSPSLSDLAAELRSARVLVTGATGFIGRHLCAQLTAAGVEVHGTAQRAPSPTDRDLAEVHWRSANLTRKEQVKDLVRDTRPDVVFHLASVVTGNRDASVIVPAFQVNLASTVYLLEATLANGRPRVVHAGTLEEADVTAGDVPASPYAVAKTAASLYARFFLERYELPVAQARIFMVYGPGVQDPKKLVPYVVRGLLEKKQIELSSGQRPVDWIYVDDVVEGLIRMAIDADGRSLEDLAEPVDLGTGQLTPVRDVVKQLYAELGKGSEPPFGSLPDRADEPVLAADTDATLRRLDWRPAIDLDSGLDRTIRGFREELGH